MSLTKQARRELAVDLKCSQGSENTKVILYVEFPRQYVLQLCQVSSAHKFANNRRCNEITLKKQTMVAFLEQAEKQDREPPSGP
ncbi:hypothetical protein QG37_00025 [Candidozyma auris]|uniref:Uncharacterized protein n=1 Tax=Candidozyma auris TaxID=498019 RepID=A0A0L0P8F9_CANAR|nr:hypothetical protein QG37_00025 [[Candida] auris]